jgi:hypothetical protein
LSRTYPTLPIGVVGSASSFYLETIVAALREKHPGVELHGLLPEALAVPAAGLFESTVVLRGGFVSRWLAARRFLKHKEYQCWVVPCTNEPYSGMKFLAFLLPLRRRRIYNELADGFPAREVRTLYGHFRWRLRDHLSYQIVAATVGRNWIARLGQIFFYSVRLLAGAAALFQVRLRVWLRPTTPKAAPRIDLLLLGPPGAVPDLLHSARVTGSAASKGSVRVVAVPLNGSLREVNEAIRASDADFVCLLDRDCRISPDDWIERLLASFDDRTAQVGPQLASLDRETLLRGLLLEGRESLAWNFDNAVQWRGRPECLEVDALPRFCILLRRRIFSETGYFAEDSGTMDAWADARFSHRLAALGWRSVCNRSVTATHPLVTGASPPARELTEEVRT